MKNLNKSVFKNAARESNCVNGRTKSFIKIDLAYVLNHLSRYRKGLACKLFEKLIKTLLIGHADSNYHRNWEKNYG